MEDRLQEERIISLLHLRVIQNRRKGAFSTDLHGTGGRQAAFLSFSGLPLVPEGENFQKVAGGADPL